MFPRTALRGAAGPPRLDANPAASRFDHTTILALPGPTFPHLSAPFRRGANCNTNNTALIQINDDVEIGELDDTWSNAFAGWNLIASIGSYVSFAGLIIFLFGMGYAFARKVRAASNPWGAGA